MIRKVVLFSVMLVVLGATAAFAFPPIDLTTSGAMYTSADGTIWSQAITVSAGPGAWDPFLRVQEAPYADGIEEGFNTSYISPPLDDRSGPWTHDLVLSDLRVQVVGGVAYYVFTLDINEATTPPDNFLSLDEVRIYTSPTAGLATYPDVIASALLRYDMDGAANQTVYLDANLQTSVGVADMELLIPTSYFAGTIPSHYVYLYCKLGASPGVQVDLHAGDGYEQWSALRSAPFEDIGAALPDASGTVAWGDYDNDGDLDLAFVGVEMVAGFMSNFSRIYRNTGGSFADVNAGLQQGVGNEAVAWGDYDNDGDLDLVLTGYSSAGPYLYFSALYQNTGGSFTDVNAGLPGTYNGSLAWGDYDNDGDLDLALTGVSDSSSPISRVYRNTCGSFEDINAGLPGVMQGSTAWGDYDNDGDLDLVITGQSDYVGTLISRVYRNTGGSFVDINAGLPGVVQGSAVWGDYDNDGDLDLAVCGDRYSGGGDILRVYRNTGGSFVDINAGLPGVSIFPSGVAWGDYDNDGDLDLAVSGWGDSGPISRVYRNTGGSFADINAGLPDADGAVAWGDYDNDGDLDLALSAWVANYTFISRLYRNTSPIANTPPTAPTGLSVAFGATTATFHWSAASDAQTPSAGLSYNLRIGTTPGGGEIMSPMASAPTGYRRVAQLGNANENLQWPVLLRGSLGCSFYWSVQAVDPAFAGSAFAAEHVVPASAGPGWPVCGVPLSAAPKDQVIPVSVADGCGGAIVAWASDSSQAGGASLFIGRVSASGALSWGADGVLLATSISYPPSITTDGAGGAIIGWADYNSTKIYAQRVSAFGCPQWGAGGLLICSEPGAGNPALISDDVGGAILAWHDSRGGGPDVYAQRVRPDGAIAWTADGVPLSVASGIQGDANLASDGNRGAIVTWVDTRNGNEDVYAQRVRLDGVPLWAADGVAICTAAGNQDHTPIVSDGEGGGIIAWQDSRGTDRHIYAQRVNGGGFSQWAPNGLELSPRPGQQGFPVVVADGARGAIVAWQDERNGPDPDIYAQRVSGSGLLQWLVTGAPLCTASGQQTAPKLATDGASGALATWQDQRSGTHTEIYVQHVVSSGARGMGWPRDGVGLCGNNLRQQTPVIVSSAPGGAIIAWEDWRSGGADIYAARIEGGGTIVTAVELPPPHRVSLELTARPNPFSNDVRLGFELPAAMAVRLEVFDVSGRRVRSSAPAPYAVGAHTIGWDGRSDDGVLQSKGIYFVRVRGPGYSVTRRVVRLK